MTALILGANGQLGRALNVEFPGSDLVDMVATETRNDGARGRSFIT